MKKSHFRFLERKPFWAHAFKSARLLERTPLEGIPYFLVEYETFLSNSKHCVLVAFLTLAAEDEYGSSNIDQILGLVFCHHDKLPA